MPARRAWGALPYSPRPGDVPVPGIKIRRGAIHTPGAAVKKAVKETNYFGDNNIKNIRRKRYFFIVKYLHNQKLVNKLCHFPIFYTIKINKIGKIHKITSNHFN